MDTLNDPFHSGGRLHKLGEYLMQRKSWGWASLMTQYDQAIRASVLAHGPATDAMVTMDNSMAELHACSVLMSGLLTIGDQIRQQCGFELFGRHPEAVLAEFGKAIDPVEYERYEASGARLKNTQILLSAVNKRVLDFEIAVQEYLPLAAKLEARDILTDDDVLHLWDLAQHDFPQYMKRLRESLNALDGAIEQFPADGDYHTVMTQQGLDYCRDTLLPRMEALSELMVGLSGSGLPPQPVALPPNVVRLIPHPDEQHPEWAGKIGAPGNVVQIPTNVRALKASAPEPERH